MRLALAFFFFVVAALPALAQRQDLAKVEIKATHVAGSVWMLKGAGGNIAATVGDDGIAIVDDQFAPLAPKIRAALAAFSTKPVRFVVNTHWHSDHTGGNASFADTATIIASANVRKRLASGGDVRGKRVEPSPAAALPVVTFEQGLTLHFNGEEVRAIALRPGHTDGDTAVWFVKSNVVHLGDDFVTYGFPFVDVDSGGSVRGMIGALDELVARIPKDAKVIPGHGTLSNLDDVRRFARSLEEMLAAVEKAPKPVDAKVLAPWASWNGDFVKADDFLKVLLREAH